MDLATVDKLLTSTRTVRRRLDLERPVSPQIIQDCLEIALQAPTGGNAQNWRFVVVTDEVKKEAIGELYRKSFEIYARSEFEQTASQGQGALYKKQRMKVVKSAIYLSQNLGKVPVLLIPCYRGRVESLDAHTQAGFYGSILPAVWSFMLALRARGLGAAWTTLHIRYEQEVGAILDIPPHYTQVALLPVAYYTGADFRPAKRRPAAELTYWEGWGKTI